MLTTTASGDLRNVIKTIEGIPANYNGKLSIVLNDKDPVIVVRNFATLWLLLQDGDAQETATEIVHLWYSAFLPPSLSGKFRGDIRNAVTSFCDQIQSEPTDSVQTKTFKFGQRQIHMTFQQKAWLSLHAHLHSSAQPFARAKNNRLAVTMAPERQENRDCDAFSQTPRLRLCELRFREKGVLLPFGASSDSFKIPNP